MIPYLSFLFAWSARSALAILLAGAICVGARRSSAAAQNLVWRSALAATLVIGVGMLITPRLGVGIHSESTLAATVLAPSVAASSAASTVDVSAPNPVRSARKPPRAHPEPTEGAAILIAALIYALGALVSASRWGVSLAHIRRICRAARPADGFENTLLADAPELNVPFTLGWRRPVIVLPAASVGWTPDRLRAVILHERAHVKRNDWIWQSAAAMTAALQWFNPAAWLLASRLRATAEEAADNEVLEAGVAASGYAAELVSLAATRPIAAVAVMGMARRTGLSTRLRNILSADRNRLKAGRRFGLTVGVGFGLAGLVLASYSPRAVSPAVSAVTGWATVGFAQSSGRESYRGVRVGIEFVGPSSSSNLPTWHADGSPTGPDEPKRHGVNYSGSGGQSGLRGVAIGYQLEGLPHSDPFAGDELWPLPSKLGGIKNNGSAGGMDWSVGKGFSEKTFVIPSSWNAADLEIGLPHGKPHRLAESEDGQGSLQIRWYQEPNRPRPEDWTSIRFILPKAAEGKDWRLLAFDAKGDSLPIQLEFDGQPINEKGEVAWHAFYQGAATKIARFTIEARDYEWIKVRNISLYPRDVIIHP
jgi:beta-lactamase regulating signal transducer with metallopeptidase domain